LAFFLRKLTLKDETIKKFENSEDPAASVIDFMISKAILLDELFDAFEALGHEEGLLFLNKPVSDIKITQMPPEIVTVSSPEKLQVVCEAQGFPIPTVEYFKDGVSVAVGREFTRDNASLADSGLYQCIVKQRRSNDVVIKELNFEVVVKTST
jgi:hypothetical protein